jgi:DNA repair exonuclease SbcCD nuclease subunit
MRIVHTADVHLKKAEEKRLQIFQGLIRKAAEMGADYFIIAGDLFDSDADATQLRNTVRKMFEGVKYTFLIIPGNHDMESFGPEYEYGKNVVQLTDVPFSCHKIEGFKFCGVPYGERKFSDSIRDMPKDVDLLIAHGTLYDRSFIFSVLEDIETEYMPIHPVHLEGIARYVALGHLHSRNIELRYGKTQVVYSGSPTALDTKCIVPRHFYIIEINGAEVNVSKHPVEGAHYWAEKEFFVFPDVEETIVTDIELFLAEIDRSTAVPNVSIRGYTLASEREFRDRIEPEVAGLCKQFERFKLEIAVQSWDIIMQNRMVQRFVSKTKELDDDLRTKVFEIAFPIFDRALR